MITRTVKFAIAALPLLLGSTAAFAADFGQAPEVVPASGTIGGISLGVGVIGYELPGQPTGPVSTGTGSYTANDTTPLIGWEVTGGAAFGITSVGSYNVLLGINGFYSQANGSSTVTNTFSGTGVVTISGVSVPANTDIVVTTDPAGGPSGSVTIDNVNPQGHGFDIALSTELGGGLNAANAGAVESSSDGNSFGYGGASIGADSILAFGAAAATDGGLFIAAGDLDGLQVKTDFTQSLIYTGGDLTISLGNGTDGTTQVAVYGGPSFRYIDQSSTRNVSVDIPEATPNSVPPTIFPTFSMLSNDDVKSDYYGGVVGMSVTQNLNDFVAVTLGGEGSVYWNRASLASTESYSVTGGNGNGNVGWGDQTVNASPVSFSADNFAYALRGQASVSLALTPSIAVALGGSLDYLSAVPVVNRSAAVDTTAFDSSTGTGTVSYPTSPSKTATFDYGAMWAAASTFSVTAHF